MEHLDVKLHTTSTGSELLWYKERIMLIFIIDTGKYIMENSKEWFAGGTFDTKPNNISQWERLATRNLSSVSLLFCQTKSFQHTKNCESS